MSVYRVSDMAAGQVRRVETRVTMALVRTPHVSSGKSVF